MFFFHPVHKTTNQAKPFNTTMTNPADTTHVRFAALQNLCTKELILDKYMKRYPEKEEEKKTWEIPNGGARMSVNGFNYCQLVYLRDTYRVSDVAIPNYADTMLSLCPETVKVNKEMAALQMTMGFVRYDNRYGDPLIFAQKLKTAMQTDMASIRAGEYTLCGLDGDTTLEVLLSKIAAAQENMNERLAELWKAEADVRRLDHAKVFMLVKGVDPSERETKRARGMR